MRAPANLLAFLCAALLVAPAFAQERGKGGPSMDPLGDRRHGDAEPEVASPRTARETTRVKRKVVRRTRSVGRGPQRIDGSAPAATPPPQRVAAAKPTRAGSQAKPVVVKPKKVPAGPPARRPADD